MTRGEHRDETYRERRPHHNNGYNNNNSRQHHTFRSVRRCYVCGIPVHLSFQCRNSERPARSNRASQQTEIPQGTVRIESANAVFTRERSRNSGWQPEGHRVRGGGYEDYRGFPRNGYESDQMSVGEERVEEYGNIITPDGRSENTHEDLQNFQ